MKKTMFVVIAIVTVSMMFLLGGCGASDQPEDNAVIPDNETIEIQDEPECVTADEPECINAEEPEYITADEPETVKATEEYGRCLFPGEEGYDDYEEVYEEDYDDEPLSYESEPMDSGDADDIVLSMNEDVNQMVFDEMKTNMPGDWTYRNDIDNVVCDMYFAEDGSIKLEAYDYDNGTEDLAGGTWRFVRDGDEAVLVIKMSNKFYNFETRWALCDCYFDGTIDLSGLSFFYDTEINATGYFTKAY